MATILPNRPSARGINRNQVVAPPTPSEFEPRDAEKILDITDPFFSYLPVINVLVHNAGALPKKDCFLKLSMGSVPTKPAKTKVCKQIDAYINEEFDLVVERGENPWRVHVRCCSKAIKTQTLAECYFDLPPSFTQAGDKHQETLKLKPRGEVVVTFTAQTALQFPLMSFQNHNLTFAPVGMSDPGLYIETTVYQAVGLLADTRISTMVSYGLSTYIKKFDKVKLEKSLKTRPTPGFNPYWNESTIFTLTTNQDSVIFSVIATKKAKGKARGAILEDIVTVSVNDLKELATPTGGFSQRWLPLPVLGGVLGVGFKILSAKNLLFELPDPPIQGESSGRDFLKGTSGRPTRVGTEESYSFTPTQMSLPAQVKATIEKPHTNNQSTPRSSALQASAQAHQVLSNLSDDHLWNSLIGEQTPVSEDLAALETAYKQSLAQLRENHQKELNDLNKTLRHNIESLQKELDTQISNLQQEYLQKMEQEKSQMNLTSQQKNEEYQNQIKALAENHKLQQQEVKDKLRGKQDEISTEAQIKRDMEFAELKEKLQFFVEELTSDSFKKSLNDPDPAELEAVSRPPEQVRSRSGNVQERAAVLQRSWSKNEFALRKEVSAATQQQEAPAGEAGSTKAALPRGASDGPPRGFAAGSRGAANSSSNITGSTAPTRERERVDTRDRERGEKLPTRSITPTELEGHVVTPTPASPTPVAASAGPQPGSRAAKPRLGFPGAWTEPGQDEEFIVQTSPRGALPGGDVGPGGWLTSPNAPIPIQLMKTSWLKLLPNKV